ncbi:MAG: ABC transporter ATP-binding protein [Oscillospiraceae bacterium]
MARAKPKNLRNTAHSMGAYIKPHTAVLSFIAILSIISALAGVIGTYMLKPIINNYILPGDLGGLLRMVLLLGGIYVAGALATYVYQQLMVRVAQKIISEIRSSLFTHLQTLPLRYFDGHTHGNLMSRFTNDIDTLVDALNNSFAVLIQSAVTVVGTFIMLFALNATLSLVVLVSYALMFLFVRFAGRKSHGYFSQQQKHLAEVNSFVEEMVEGQKVVKIFNHEKESLEGFDKRNEALKKAGAGALTYSGITIPVVVSISYLNYAIAALLGALFAISGQLDLGSLASYLVFVRQGAMPMNQFSQQVNILLAALAGFEHINEVLQQKPEIDNGTVTLVRADETPDYTGDTRWAWRVPEGQTSTYVPLRGDARFYDVVFSYVPKHTILKDISLFARPGEKLAFVGSTGAGKTTITNLINRFYELDSGTITYDGIDIKDIKKDDLRHSLSVVLQDTHLFTGTIADNIRYGRLNATDEQVVEAAKLANADSFIRRLPKGYNTMLSGDGSNLSAGQRQLLSIARAAISTPPVLILDEATSNIDTYTEQLVGEGMDHLMQGRTVFVIAHRLSTVRGANAIMVLEQGEIIERGSHDELVSQKGRYYQLYTGQFELS